ncbi:hypothetical protein IFT66_10605 [Rhizobium sp. CFBP 13726]|uniref:hypothetical protein n=1 Tax=Rhizobium sp. CFBP 13726 TaxID=2775296 RepID=UPI0017858494|nr:hypothetical protein [Rhizobium sp. CFBP 13726]MBD8651527.1 hypothetical protein [Rhizobium sp. CFBP 13726]
MSADRDGKQAGPLMKRVTIEGRDHFLPVDAKLAEPFPAGGTEEEQMTWMDKHMAEELGGTW